MNFEYSNLMLTRACIAHHAWVQAILKFLSLLSYSYKVLYENINCDGGYLGYVIDTKITICNGSFNDFSYTARFHQDLNF
jgi:hypothetical protein